jgi:probable HAF family extracellular repeat protein
VARLESLEGRTLLSVGGYNFQTIDDPLGVNGTEAVGINARGQIVGVYFDASTVSHGFLLSGGQYTTLDDPNAGAGAFQGTTAEGINARGQIVGFYTDANDVNHGFLLSGGQYTTLDVPNASDTAATGINSSGQIVGEYDGGAFGFLLSGGQYTTLSDTNGIVSFAAMINASGTIVGTYLAPNFVVHGYVLRGGQYTTLDDPNAGTGAFQGTEAFGINDSGSIVGGYLDTNSAVHGYLATPVHGGGPALAGAGGSALLPQTTVTADTAMGTAPGPGGSDGEGIGGGLHLATGASVFLKKTKVTDNFASTSSDDLYGTVTIL